MTMIKSKSHLERMEGMRLGEISWWTGSIVLPWIFAKVVLSRGVRMIISGSFHTLQ
jgi:hypothetical protein